LDSGYAERQGDDIEKEPEQRKDQPSRKPEEKPPPFNPDPDLVTFLERGRKHDPKKVWKESEPSR
jgi:hypothetical protein